MHNWPNEPAVNPLQTLVPIKPQNCLYKSYSPRLVQPTTRLYQTSPSCYALTSQPWSSKAYSVATHLPWLDLQALWTTLQALVITPFLSKRLALCKLEHSNLRLDRNCIPCYWTTFYQPNLTLPVLHGYIVVHLTRLDWNAWPCNSNTHHPMFHQPGKALVPTTRFGPIVKVYLSAKCTPQSCSWLAVAALIHHNHCYLVHHVALATTLATTLASTNHMT